MPNISNHPAAFVQAISRVSEGTRLFPVFLSCTVKRRVVFCLSVTNRTADRRDVNQEVFAHISLRNSAGLETVLFLTLPWRFYTLSDATPVGCVSVWEFLPTWLGWGLGSNQFRPVHHNLLLEERWRCRQLLSHLMGWKAEYDVLGQLPLNQKAILSLLTRQQLSGQEPPSRGSCSMFSAEAYVCTALYRRWCQKNARSQLHVCQARCIQRLACCTQVT